MAHLPRCRRAGSNRANASGSTCSPTGLAEIVIARLEDITAEDWQATGEAGDVTAKLQRCDLFADGDDTTVHVRAQTGVTEGDVRFNTSALHRFGAPSKAPVSGPRTSCGHRPTTRDGHRTRAGNRSRPWTPGVFFGRDITITSGLAALRGMRTPSPERLSSPASMFVILGPSGSGKSSFLRAGLVPRLHRDDHTFMVTGVMRAGHALTGEQGFAAAIDRARQALRLPDHPLDDVEQACLDGERRCHPPLARRIAFRSRETARAGSGRRFAGRDGAHRDPAARPGRGTVPRGTRR